jgi:hypothetical protein
MSSDYALMRPDDEYPTDEEARIFGRKVLQALDTLNVHTGQRFLIRCGHHWTDPVARKPSDAA